MGVLNRTTGPQSGCQDTLYLRVSVTDRCNLRCTYCCPQDVVCEATAPLTDRAMLCLIERIDRRRPVGKLRLTGGEPLLRPGLCRLIGGLRRALPGAELALTTNGAKLERAAEGLKLAGLDRLNISLDTLSAERFALLTGVDGLERVTSGIIAAREAGFLQLKLNSVLLRSSSDEERLDLVRFAASQVAELRWIELMPFGPAVAAYEREFLSAEEAMAGLQARLVWLGSLGRQGTAVRHVFKVDGDHVVVGFISPVSVPFCGECDRLRLDSRGRLRACLRKADEVDLAAPLLSGDLDEVDRRIDTVLAMKGCAVSGWDGRAMVATGG
jgi:cyclic pyranopterin phosphate synthase